MKFSKVRENKGKFAINAKTAVISEKECRQGILYNDPSRNGQGRKGDHDTEAYVNDRIRKSRVLYSVFNEEKTGKSNQRYDKRKSLLNVWKNAIKLSGLLKADDALYEKYAEVSYENRKNHIEESPRFEDLGLGIRNAKAEECHRRISEENLIRLIRESRQNIRDDKQITEEIIDSVIINYLKKSLSREKTRKALKCFLMKAYGLLDKAEKDINIQRDFIDFMLEDYYRVREKGQIAVSIRNNNMPVQPDGGNEEKVFSVSGGKESKKDKSVKSEEQGAFKNFISSYATLDEKKRNEMLVCMRRIVNLYFYGGSEDTSLDVWEDHAKHRECKELFITVSTNADITDRDAEKMYREKIRAEYRKENIACYRRAIAETDKDNEGRFFTDKMLNHFFIRRIESGVERIYLHIKEKQEYKLQKGYVSEKVWKDLINYISVKYIAIGKAVYNYAMEELTKDSDEISLGKIDEAYISGINSFDYELIKAEEMLQRETAVYVAFASRHLAHQTVDLDEENSDFLLLKDRDKLQQDGTPVKDNILNFIKKDRDVKNAILQYFGGKSQWQNFDFEKYYPGQNAGVDLLGDLRKVIYSKRNDSFHYATENHDRGSWNKSIIADMFAREADKVALIQKDKIYSNNLPMFYTQTDLGKTMENLYGKNVERASQVPAFNSVFVRKNFPDAVLNSFDIDEKGMDNEQKLKFHNALYYLCKEIYYNAFLQDDDVLKRFVKVAEDPANKYNPDHARNLKQDKNDKEKKRYREYEAQNDFAKKIMTIMANDPKITLSQICQMIMTEYNQQNTGNKRKKSTDGNKKNPDSYQHYKMLLLKYLREAFVVYAKEKFSYILKPDKQTRDNKCTKEEFLADYAGNIHAYDELKKKVSESVELQKWYVIGRFLSPKQVNHMLGTIHSYKQFVWDIYRRAAEVGTDVNKRVSETKIAGADISDIDAVIDLCVKLSGITSNNVTDYFKDNEEYAEYLINFVDYEYQQGECAWALKEFCKDNSTADQKISVYYDSENPIVNRNIVLSKLFGEEDLLKKLITRIKRDDFAEYYNVQNMIKPYQTKGIYDTEEEQRTIKRFQEIKNHIEFRDLMDYSEITDELQGQLINWIYLRERDLMYYQLGFHYTCLHNDSEKPESYKMVNCEGRIINGAILYQICSLYTNGIPMYTRNKDNSQITKTDGRESTGAKIGEFLAYSKGFKEECSYNMTKETCYNAGLEIFENINEHDDITNLRNYIEHFRYYVKQDRSMISIYSEVFDRFFTYDMKYRKNVPNILYNILLGYFVNAKFEFTSGTKRINKAEKVCAAINIPAKGGIISEKFTYKIKGSDKPVELTARSKKYLETVARLLYYPEKFDTSEMVKDFEAISASKNPAGKESSKYNNSRKENAQDRKNYEEYKKKKQKGSSLHGMDGDVDWAAIMKQLK